MKIYLSIFNVFLFFGYNNSTENSKLIYCDDLNRIKDDSTLNIVNEEYRSLEFAKVEKLTADSKVYLIKKACAVSIFPDTSWINMQQRSMSEDNWNEIVSDNLYYQNIAEKSLKEKGIKIIYKLENKRFLKFIKHDKREFIIDTQKMKDIWGLILFNGIADPVILGTADINDVLKTIYNK